MPEVVIIGAGTMGAGIAQVAAQHGWSVWLLDVDEPTARRAIEAIGRRLDRLVEKGRMTPAERDDAAGRLRVLDATTGDVDAELVIEAVVEDLAIKSAVLGAVRERVAAGAIIATNTSSLSVTALGDAVGEPRRTVGMHFFNPAPLMKLVEVVSGARTDATVADRVAEIAAAWGKHVARAADVPGFIVNHVARPYYLEAFRIVEDGLAGAAEVDQAMKTLGGFRMGPLELTDLIGQDVNTATTRSVWGQLDRPPLLAPSALQERLVAEGHLGRKTGRGVYDYGGDEPVAAVEVERRPLPDDPAVLTRVDAFVDAAHGEGKGDAVTRYVFARILLALIVQAAHARHRGVATTRDIDTALKYGTNYPHGPFEWAERIGVERCAAAADALNTTLATERFTMPELPVS
ncbi:MAG: 3-hydroxyacyl-CoA dehydrogenase NAD-binding domain-containing protein [Planctomycetota bacterium]